MLRCRLRGWEQPIPESDQFVRLEASVLRHIRRHRQTGLATQEAGGQLFGRLTPELVLVSDVVGPHPTDERSRFGFRSDPLAAQAAIERFARRGLLYLGEWHTHAERVPQFSSSDEEAMRKIYARSRLNTAALLLVILGVAGPDQDIRVWYIDSEGELRPVG